MKEICRERSPIKIGFWKSILEDEGIQVFVRNENLSGVEVPIPVFYPALCVVNDEDYDQALAILKKHLEETPEESGDPNASIACPSCREENPGNFDVCWSCEAALR